MLIAMYDFTRARNHMLVIISVANAHRTGVLINFKLTEHENGKQTNDGHVVFSVCEHKSTSIHGVATLAVNSDEAKLLLRKTASVQKQCAICVHQHLRNNDETIQCYCCNDVSF